MSAQEVYFVRGGLLIAGVDDVVLRVPGVPESTLRARFPAILLSVGGYLIRLGGRPSKRVGLTPCVRGYLRQQ